MNFNLLENVPAFEQEYSPDSGTAVLIGKSACKASDLLSKASLWESWNHS